MAATLGRRGLSGPVAVAVASSINRSILGAHETFFLQEMTTLGGISAAWQFAQNLRDAQWSLVAVFMERLAHGLGARGVHLLLRGWPDYLCRAVGNPSRFMHPRAAEVDLS
jgi:hypothetical protein